ncbi:MAG TPA: amino acid permease [Streptosporangiaceae bacterium]|nr:amino acid permease [Streptosporangiaceae bacterium]
MFHRDGVIGACGVDRPDDRAAGCCDCLRERRGDPAHRCPDAGDRERLRKLNLWNANTGASFEWVGRAINPYLGFLTGWLMIAAYVIATVSGVEVLGPSVLAVFGANSSSTWANTVIGTAVGVIMLVIAIAGIKITARTQVSMAVIEYAILLGLGVAGLVLVLMHHQGTVPISLGWLSPAGIGGSGSALPGSWWRCSCSPGGTAPCTSTRRSRTATATPAALPSPP